MSKILKRGNKKLINAWAFYDWANSVYSLVISSAIFPIYYTAVSAAAFKEGNVPDLLAGLSSESIINIVTALGFLIVSVLSPLLSGVADYSGRKRAFLKVFCYLGSISCVLLAFFSFDYLYVSLSIYMLALIGFWGSLVFYNSFLPDVAFPEQQDAVSAKGFSLGYIGSVLLLVLCLGLVQGGFYPEEGLFSDSDVLRLDAVQLSFILVGLWWWGFAQYTYCYLPAGNVKEAQEGISIWNSGFLELKKIWFKLNENLQMKRYLGAFFIYSMAVQTVMIVATYFGTTEVEWPEGESTQGLIVSILLIQLVAVLGAWIASKLSRKLGNINTLIIINIIWASICVYGYFVVTPMQFYITAAAVGFVMGSIQSLSRSTYSKMIPEGATDTASYFSFYDVAEKVGIVLGLAIFIAVREQFDSMRYSILFLLLFFVIGAILLMRVPRLKVD
ncbi:MAG: MFS transporter [Nonlabens sp.]